MRPTPALASSLAALLIAGFLAPPAAPAAQERSRKAPAADAPAALDIPFEKFTLGNGLTLIVHEDHDAPIVATEIWYHVGSKNERPGRSGFAHLFEHLMFQGSENHKDEWFKPFDSAGVTSQNGTTNTDRTNYFQTVPKGALDMTLWLESDRMGHLLGIIDDALIAEQRGVVQNEKRQGENQPYGRSREILAAGTFPPGHPYSWTTIGSMEDLDAASLDDVKDWFKTYYGAANAVLVVAGDVDPKDVHAKVEKYFGDIPAGPPVARPSTWVPRLAAEKRAVMQDRVPQAKLTMYWPVPQWGTPEAQYLGLASDVLSTGKTSRLYKRLVYDEQLCTDVSAGVWTQEIASIFLLTATAKPGQDLAPIERIVKEELARLIERGPTVAELDRAKTASRAYILRSFETIGGFNGKADTLAESQVFGGRPDAWKAVHETLMAATPDDVTRASREWLTEGAFVLEAVPYPDHPAVAGIERTTYPVPTQSPDPTFPALVRAELKNGMRVILVERHDLPLVEMALHFDAGYAADSLAELGTASLVGAMLDEGTATRSALQISDSLDALGAELRVQNNLDMTMVSMSALADQATFDPSLDLFADVVMRPSFPQDELDRQVKQRLAGIKREKADPNSMSLRVLPALLFGKGHAYSGPLTGSGTEASVGRMTRDSLVKFHSSWYRPNNATLVVVGDTTMASLEPKLERLFGSWQRADVPRKTLDAVNPQASARVFLLDRPGSLQSSITAAVTGPPKSSPDDLAIESFARVLGNGFSSRINMNLREDKHWSYGTSMSASGTRGPRFITVNAPVQTDKTVESVAQVLAEISDVAGKRAITADELAKVKDRSTLSLPGRWETSSAIAQSIGELVRYGLPDRYWDAYASAVRSLDLATVSKVAQRIPASQLTWVIVGDRSKIEKGIRDLNLGPVQVIDADGNPVADAAVSQ